MTLADAKAPTNLPAYAPLYANAKILSSMTNEKAGSGGIVSFVVPDKPETVIAFYEKTAAANKLTTKTTIPGDANNPTTAMLGEPGTQRALTVAAGPTDDGSPGTKVSLTYGAP